MDEYDDRLDKYFDSNESHWDECMVLGFTTEQSKTKIAVKSFKTKRLVCINMSYLPVWLLQVFQIIKHRQITKIMFMPLFRKHWYTHRTISQLFGLQV